MRSSLLLIVCGCSLVLAGCADPNETPYFPGRSAADVPDNIGVIYLAHTGVIDIGMTSLGAGRDLGSTEETAAPSQDERDMMAVARDAAVSKFKFWGIQVTDDSRIPADLTAKFEVGYQRELGVVHRSALMRVQIYDTSGVPLFKIHSFDLGSPNGAVALIMSSIVSRETFVWGVGSSAAQIAIDALKHGSKAPARRLPVKIPEP
jgi:hypothetical protein